MQFLLKHLGSNPTNPSVCNIKTPNPGKFDIFGGCLDNEIASLRHRPAGGLYSYLFRNIWENLTRPAQRLLMRLAPAQGKYLTEGEITALAGIAPEERVRYDLALAELVKYSMLEVTGEFQKRYRLHPLTINFLKTGLIEHWQKAQKS